jgi:hypothetical protein
MNKEEFYPLNLRHCTHFYNADMAMKTYKEGGEQPQPSEAFYIPLRKEILEPMGFEAVYDDFTSEIYFQKDLAGYRLRVYPMEDRIKIIDLKFLHTVVDARAKGLHELENYLYAVDIGEAFTIELYSPDVLEAINDFGKNHYWDYFTSAENRVFEFASKE